ncbi:MAG TPA: protein kinase [Vicinamibacterales bacterium]|nr:protein kinase [Vicinamibacterales bacterium]
MFVDAGSPVPGSRIGPYEIVACIGEGGMGRVYRGVDTSLKREVAVKVLPPSVRTDAERLARFRREAELLAALNHPNIAQVYGLEQSGGELALVMELAEGPTLAERIAEGPLAPDDALGVARQVLDALDAAHDRGIVHRDLKPANIKIGPDGAVKVLDFGLAKAIDASGAASGAGDFATVTSPALTGMGLILGTAAYMAPEQARGRAVDRRADLWAFGCVLYEMLTGTRAFGGEDVTETLANVLKSEARVEALPASMPPRVCQVIGACLQKDPRRRLASAQDARLLLDGTFDSRTTARGATAPLEPGWRRALPYALGGVAAAAVVGLVAVRFWPPPAMAPVSRFSVLVPAGHELRSTGRPVVAVAPDGSAFVYNSTSGLRLRKMSELDARVIPGTEAPLTSPVFSPDGQHVAFYAPGDREVKRLAVAGGAPLSLARNIGNPLGIDWSDRGTILLALQDGIARLPDTGGTPEIIVAHRENERTAMPQLLPSGDAVLFTVVAGGGTDVHWDRAHVVVQSLRTGERTKILEGARDARYLPTGHLVYAAGDDLFAVAFDPVTSRTSGASIALVQGVWWRSASTAVANWSVSRNGTLLYVPNIPDDALRPVWVGRDGAVVPAERLAAGQGPRLSPDGKRLLVAIDGDVWIYEADTGRRTRLTTDRASGRAAWDPTGARVAYTSDRSGSDEIWVANADGTGTPRRLTDLPGPAHVDSWSPDGRRLAFHHHPPGEAPNEILVIGPDDPSPTPVPLVQGEFAAEDAVFSPDGRYIAYLSAHSGRREVYVRAVPGPGPEVPVSVGGAREPVWGRNGEIFYRTPAGEQMMAVRVSTSPSLTIGTPMRLFEGDYFVAPRTGSPRPQYDVTADGSRFLMLQPDRSVRPQIVVVQNWFEELKRAIPVK